MRRSSIPVLTILVTIFVFGLLFFSSGTASYGAGGSTYNSTKGIMVAQETSPSPTPPQKKRLFFTPKTEKSPAEKKEEKKAEEKPVPPAKPSPSSSPVKKEAGKPKATPKAVKEPEKKTVKAEKDPKKKAPAKASPIPRTSAPLIVDKPVPLQEGEHYTYQINWRGEMAGFSKFFVAKKMALAGEGFYKLESMSRMKIGMGKIDDLSFSSQMTIRTDNFLPKFFHCEQKQGNEEFKLSCLISNNLVAQQNMSSRGDVNVFEPFREGNIPVIYMGNLWGRFDTLVEHYWTILKSGRKGPVKAYDPILQHMGEIEVVLESETAEPIEVNGIKTKGYRYKLLGFDGKLLFNIWTDHRRNILKMEEPGGGLTIEITGGNPADEFEAVQGIDMWKDRVCQSNIFFPNPRNIDFLKARVETSGPNVSPDYREYGGVSQTFEGGQEDGILKGVVTVEKNADFQVKDPVAFPLKEEFTGELAQFTNPQLGIESKSDTIINKSLEVAWKSKDVWEAARKVNEWAHENITLGISLPSAKMTLANEQGNSESRALLCIAMCRSLGIPARSAGGAVFSAGSFMPHYWFEVYTGPASGWVPLDPSTGEAGDLGATHIKFFQSGDLWTLNVKVLDFEPKPPERLTFINRELTWPVGEERIYEVKQEGQVLGEEKALMIEVGVLDELETYKMTLQSKLKLEGRDVEANADYWMTPQGLPVKYEKELKSGVRQEKQVFTLHGKMMEESLEGFRGNLTRNIPYSFGSYMADPHFLCQWALIGGQFFDLKLGKNYQFYVFIPETLTVESVSATVKQFESVESGEQIYDCFKVETNKGIVFWVEKGNNRVVKVSFTAQGVDLELVKTTLKI